MVRSPPIALRIASGGVGVAWRRCCRPTLWERALIRALTIERRVLAANHHRTSDAPSPETEIDLGPPFACRRAPPGRRDAGASSSGRACRYHLRMHPVDRVLTWAALFLRGKPRETREFQDLKREACEWTSNRQDALKRVFEIGTYDRFEWDQEKGTIVFSTAGSPKVAADIQFSGTISSLTRSWLWACANTTLLEPVVRASAHVRHAGEHAGYAKLTRAK